MWIRQLTSLICMFRSVSCSSISSAPSASSSWTLRSSTCASAFASLASASSSWPIYVRSYFKQWMGWVTDSAGPQTQRARAPYLQSWTCTPFPLRWIRLSAYTVSSGPDARPCLPADRMRASFNLSLCFSSCTYAKLVRSPSSPLTGFSYSATAVSYVLTALLS